MSGASGNNGPSNTDDYAGLFKGFGLLPQQAEKLRFPER